MSTTLRELTAYLDGLLETKTFSDYAPNGLQVEGKSTVKKIAVGVSANQALIDEAIAWGADAVIVHHGFFWKGEPRVLTGYRKRRIASLLRHDISLLGYHLPLDAHAEHGNNVGLLRSLGASPGLPFGGKPPIGWTGTLYEAEPRAEVVARIETAIGPIVSSFLHGTDEVRTIGVVTGGGAGFFDEALDRNVDLFISGEPSEQSQGIAVERSGNFVAVGHHATERFGPRLLGMHLARTFSLEWTFIDVPNPV